MTDRKPVPEAEDDWLDEPPFTLEEAFAMATAGPDWTREAALARWDEFQKRPGPFPTDEEIDRALAEDKAEARRAKRRNGLSSREPSQESGGRHAHPSTPTT